MHREELLVTAQTGQLSEIISELDQLLINHSDDGAEICDAYANGLLINGQITEAESLIQQWQQAYPDDPQPDYLLGRIAEFSGNMPGAESWYRKSLAKNERYFVAANSLGRVLGELGKWNEALKAYETCLAFHSPAPARLGIARCLTNLGREDEALPLLRTLLEIPQSNLNDALMQVGEPTEIDALAFELGSLEAKYERAETAVNLLSRAVEYNPKHREARYQLARALRAVGRADEAKKHFDWYQETQEKVAEINRILDKVKLDSRNLDLRYRLGMLYLDVGSQSAGVFWLRSVLAEEPAHLAAREALSKHGGAMNLPTR
ncbi:MAG: tetratricopeptide repeat protein [Planctomycetia bacterium]|nr:tetratricopeptide repeat protein [Planctomycetia bacterium]